MVASGLLVALCGSVLHADSTQQVATIETPAPQFEDWANIEPLDVHTRTNLTIVEQLRHNHYLRKDLNDSASSEVFDKYISTLDPGHSYFLQSDIEQLEKHRFKLDDALKRGDLSPAFSIFNLFQTRLVERLEYLISSVDTGLEGIDFARDESIQIDREDAPWPADPKALDDLWRKRLKAAVLAMKLNDKELSEIQTLLIKRYTNRLKQANQSKSEDAFQIYVNAYASTYDPHTQYLSPRNSENFNIDISLTFDGIGAVLRTKDDYTSVARIVPAGPADKANNIKAADRITGVGQGESGPIIDVVGWRLDDVVELIRGPAGSIVRLEIMESETNDITKVIEITRNKVQLEEQSAQKKVLTLNHNGLPRKVGVIEVPKFYIDFEAVQRGDPNYKSTTRDVRRLIKELRAEGIDGLIIDLRNNGGGSLQEADSLTGLFIKSGPTVQVKAARRRANVYADTDDQIAWEGPLGVVVNRLSASASEIFAGAIQDYQRGIIIGSQTFGKGTVQTLIPLNRGQLKLTAAKFYRVSGQSTQHQGILPDIEFPELYDASRIGESSLDDAMPWDVIKPAVYPHYAEIEPLIHSLRTKHTDRAQTDPDFRYLNELVEHSRRNSEKTELSLNEKFRRQEKAADDEWRKALENKLRIAKGEPPIKSLDELDEQDADADGADQADTESTPEEDALLRESGHILLDYLMLTQQVALAEQVVDQVDDLATSSAKLN